MKLSHKLTSNASETQFLRFLSAFIVFVGSLTVVGLYTPKTQMAVSSQSVLGESTSEYSAAYSLATDASSVSAGGLVTVHVNLVTSGQDFDSAVAVLEWDSSEFAFESAEGFLGGQFLDSFIKNDNGRRILGHVATPGDPLLTTPNGQPVPYAAVVLKALVDQPMSPIQLSSAPADVVVHFPDAGVDNSVDQSLQTAAQITFGGDGTVSSSGVLNLTEAAPVGLFGRLWAWLTSLF